MRQKRLTNTDIAGAQTLYDKALKFNPDHPTVLYNYAVLLEDARQAETLNTFFECFSLARILEKKKFTVLVHLCCTVNGYRLFQNF